ncbi:Lrp/AsnC family transcriptional regulator [Nocardia inohanensis]|uniref:Lrp/AsnC family transcriptional regulator n=1 Tax=Nocardia inohanensis TaxID=209246 RepID=UPI000A03A68F|nr:Lrp/AsnC family transcriptional regulator [Nocardia inohanensis]
MANKTAESPDIGTESEDVPRSANPVFGERDLDLVNALQINPRAPWGRIGASLGMDATTAARRWRRLTDSGLAWLTAYAPEFATVAYIRLRCRTDAIAEISEQLCAWPWVVSVERITGHYALQLTVALETPTALDAFVTGQLAALPGIIEVRPAVGLHTYLEGSHWRPQALDPVQRTLLTDASDRRPPAPARPRPGDLDLLLALGRDARRSSIDLARDTGLTESTVRRRITEMTRSHRLLFRCDFAERHAGWPVIMTYRATLAARDFESLASTLSTWPELRLCVSTADDESNLLLIAWLRTPTDSIRVETRLHQAFPQLRINERQLTVRTLKRMGRLLDPHGLAVTHIPFGLWTAGGGFRPAPA